MMILSDSRFLIGIVVLLVFLILRLVYDLKLKKRENRTLEQSIEHNKDEKSDLEIKLDELYKEYKRLTSEKSHLLELESNYNRMTDEVIDLGKDIDKKTSFLDNLKTKLGSTLSELHSVRKDLAIFSLDHDLLNVGIIDEPDYLYNTSLRYKEEIKSIRDLQKKMIKEGLAIIIPENLDSFGGNKYAKRIMSGQEKLMLKAFNIECDLLMSNIKISNYSNILERISKVATDLEKLSMAFQCSFNIDYIELKYRECEMQYHFKLKEQAEKEEQAIIKEQIREEQKAQKEYERILAKAEKEEQKARLQLERALKEFNDDRENVKLQQKIRELEEALDEAQSNEERARSMAEMTKKGHVYVISNIGSFGDDVYKIGLTRRLEPLDRVKELGDASVPFPFDVHAMIYSDDAPQLEAMLHRSFNSMRVNKVNKRKEFFNVKIEEIEEKVKEISGVDCEFTYTALAEDYRESYKLSKQPILESC